MKNKFTIGLAAVAVALGAYMVFVEAKKDAPTETKDVQVWNLTEADAKGLDTLVFKADGKEATYVRSGDVWKLKNEPTRDLLPGEWTGPYNNLKNLMATREVQRQPKDLAQWGLDTPETTIVWGGEKSPYTLKIGDKNPTGDGYFVHAGKTDTVYTVSSWKVDEWARLAKEPPLEPLPTPAASGVASPAPAATGATNPAPAADDGHGHDHDDHEGHNH